MVLLDVDISRLRVALACWWCKWRLSFVEIDLFRVGRWGLGACIESAKGFGLCGSASRDSLSSKCNGQVGRRGGKSRLRLVLMLHNNIFEDQHTLEKVGLRGQTHERHTGGRISR